MKKFLAILSVFIVCLFASQVVLASDIIRVGAGAAPTENILKPIKAPFEAATGIKLDIIPSGPKFAMEDLIAGKIDVAAAGLSFSDWMELMKKEGSEVKDQESFSSFVVGKDRIIVLLHKSNPVGKLSKEQLEGIFSGRISNWKEVGGNDLPIVIVWGKLMQGTNSMFIRNVMGGKQITQDILDATTAEDVKNKVKTLPEAIGIGPVAVADDSVKVPEIPEISRPIIFVTKGKPSAKVEKLIEFIKGEGQKYIIK